MKTVYLVRHAKAVSEAKNGSDIDRRLTKKGKKEAERTAGKLKERHIRPHRLISSPAERARETAVVFAEVLGYPPAKIMIRSELYPELKESAFFHILRSEDPSLQSVMFFGHEPSLSRIAALIDPRFSEPFPKAGIVAFRFDVPTWEGIEPTQGTLEFTEIPESLRKARRTYEAVVNEKILTAIMDVLNTQDPHTAKSIRKHVLKSSEKIAASFVNSLEALPAGKSPVGPRPSLKKKSRKNRSDPNGKSSPT
ncbi:MAG: histidine phosphatase family protein [Candidatus Aminicenantes bacterium]|nr:histidine phosphatase family protein [Candidatus Aminicenantes bacterium]